MIADPDRLVEDLSAAIRGTGDGGGTVDMSTLENEVKGLRRDIKRLASEMQSMELRTDSETIGRVSTNGQQNRISDTDPMT